jgi:catechol 2,3-dioxygenase-like lactoylglutathione lyase family enzyme
VLLHTRERNSFSISPQTQSHQLPLIASDQARPGFNFRGAWLFNYGLQIHLIESADQEPPNNEIKARVDHIAFRVKDIDAVQKQLDDRGIKFVSRHVPDTGVTQVFFLDPDGNHIECGMYPPTVTE